MVKALSDKQRMEDQLLAKRFLCLSRATPLVEGEAPEVGGAWGLQCHVDSVVPGLFPIRRERRRGAEAEGGFDV